MDTELTVIWERLTLAAASVAEAIRLQREGEDAIPQLDEAARGAAKGNLELRQVISRAGRGSAE